MLGIDCLVHGLVNGKFETLQDGKTSIFLYEPKMFWLFECETEMIGL